MQKNNYFFVTLSSAEVQLTNGSKKKHMAKRLCAFFI
jgi:hypothetical protein